MKTNHSLAKSLTLLMSFSSVMAMLPIAYADSSKTLRIMPMGDSITQGTIPGGYRKPLHDLLLKNGHKVDFVGAKTQNGDTCPDPDHWGQGGWQITKTPATIDGNSYVSIQGQNRSGLYEEMPQAISTAYFSTDNSSARNIILLQIGINDILHQVVDSKHGSFNSDAGNDGQGEGQEWVAEGCIARLQALLRLINSKAASNDLRIEVIIGTLCPLTKKWDGDPVSDVLINQVVEYNKLISTVIPSMKFTNLGVKVVDHHAATAGKLADGLHPNRKGYEAMAKVWYDGIVAAAR
jgi:lysophospholipase L1-like esterase